MSKQNQKDQYLSYINKIRKLILTYHPDPFANAQPEKFDKVHKEICNSITADTTETEFYFHMLRLINLLHDYHSFPVFRKKKNERMIDPVKSFPLDIQKMSGGYYVLGCKGFTEKINKRIHKINGTDINNVIELSRDFVVYETEESFRLRVSDNLKQPEFLNMVLGEQDHVIFQLENDQELIFNQDDACNREESRDSGNSLYKYYSEDMSEIFRHRKYFHFADGPKHNEFRVFNNNLGYYKLEICINDGIYDSLTSFFKYIFQNNISKIILDLRGNPGGMVISGLHFFRF